MPASPTLKESNNEQRGAAELVTGIVTIILTGGVFAWLISRMRLASDDEKGKCNVQKVPPPGDSRSDSQVEIQSLTAMCNDTGPIGMSDTQNVLGNNNRITFLNSYHEARRDRDAPTMNALLNDLSRTLGTDCEIYSNQLLTKKRGYPLYVPGPGRQLPIEYRREGTRIGDVGIITSSGAFDFLFNIFYPDNDPINFLGGVPQGFSPLSLQQVVFDIQENMVYGPDSYLASSSVRNISMNWISETSIVHGFESTAMEAAILVMPDGATSQDLLNTWRVYDIISKNAENWYNYAKFTRGRQIGKGDIRVVIGIDKVSFWGIATSTCNTGQTASYVFKHDPTHTYKWDCIGGFGRVGPLKPEIHGLMDDNTVPRNQAAFVRTINFTSAGDMWQNFPSEAVEELDYRSGDRNSGSGDRGSRERDGSLENGDTSSELMPGPSTRTHGFFNCTGVTNHPSAVLHSSLHTRFPDAKMVITEDTDWISVLNDDEASFPQPEDLCERILKVHKLLNHDGIVRLSKNDDAEFRPSGRMTFGEAEDMGVRGLRGAPKSGISSAIVNVDNTESESENLKADKNQDMEEDDFPDETESSDGGVVFSERVTGFSKGGDDTGKTTSQDEIPYMANIFPPRKLPHLADIPTKNLIRSTPTWIERIVGLWQPKNMTMGVTANLSGKTTNAQHGDSIPHSASECGSKQDSEDLHYSPEAPTADHEVYCRELMTKERGYPLWVPGPGMQLPIEYRREGIRIGDVGIITPFGAFDFLCNIFYPEDHPINRGSVPYGFSPLSLQQDVFDIQVNMVYGPGSYLASSSVRNISTDQTSETSINLGFESTATEGAILVMPDGATSQDLLNTREVRDFISENAQHWYTYVRDGRGRDIKNGELRVVVGVDKVSSWGIATFAHTTRQTVSCAFKRDPTHGYKWDCIGGSGRVGPVKYENYDLEDNVAPQNQCVFVRTLNFGLSERMSKHALLDADGKPFPPH